MFEDPKEKLLQESLAEQLKIGQNDKVDARERTRALNDLQSTIISNKQFEAIKNLTDKEMRRISSRLDRVNKLKNRSEDSEE